MRDMPDLNKSSDDDEIQDTMPHQITPVPYTSSALQALPPNAPAVPPAAPTGDISAEAGSLVATSDPAKEHRKKRKKASQDVVWAASVQLDGGYVPTKESWQTAISQPAATKASGRAESRASTAMSAAARTCVACAGRHVAHTCKRATERPKASSTSNKGVQWNWTNPKRGWVSVRGSRAASRPSRVPTISQSSLYRTAERRTTARPA